MNQLKLTAPCLSVLILKSCMMLNAADSSVPWGSAGWVDVRKAVSKYCSQTPVSAVLFSTLSSGASFLMTSVLLSNLSQCSPVFTLLRSQFSDDQPTAVDEAIELACSPDKLTENSVASLSPLMATLTTYRKMQQEICQVQGKQVSVARCSRKWLV